MDKVRIKRVLRAALMRLPGGRALLRAHSLSLARRRFAQAGDAADVFRHHYEVNEWGDTESVSGPGSTLQYTESIRREIARLVQDLGVETILDAPCGDYNWLQRIDWSTHVSYTGGDIVPALVERNRSLYGRSGAKFIDLDIVNDPLPSADLWLCRDCFIHLSERDIFLALRNFLRSDIAYLLTSTYPDWDLNTDIPTGFVRQLNLRLPPFSLGEPARVIDDWVEGFAVRQLALWERTAVEAALASNRRFLRAVGRRR